MASTKKKLDFGLVGLLTRIRQLRYHAKSDAEREALDYVRDEVFKIGDWVEANFPAGTKLGIAKQAKAARQVDADRKPADNPPIDTGNPFG